MGCVLAYLMNPLARLYQRTIFKGTKKDALRWSLSVAFAVVTVLLLLIALVGMLVPQLVKSLTMLGNNMDSYIASLEALTEKWGLSRFIDMNKFADFSENIMEKVSDYVTKNLSRIASASAAAGKTALNWAIALILSVYLLMSKTSLKSGTLRLMNALLPEERMRKTTAFFARCDMILTRYIAFSLLDSVIVGVVNGIFMALLKMQYVGLVSVVVAVTNLIPTFGPVIGAVIGAFVLLLVKPLHAIAFLGFTVLLQLCDGYIIKPRLFGNTLGVSGLLILIAVVIGGNMFGVVGILLAIPFAAILDFVYRDYIFTALEARKAKNPADS